MRIQRATSSCKRSEPGCKLAACLHLRRRIQCEAALRNAQQCPLRAQPPGERIPPTEKWLLCGERRATDIAKISIGAFRACAPAPMPTYHGAQFGPGSNPAQVQVCQRSEEHTSELQSPDT